MWIRRRPPEGPGEANPPKTASSQTPECVTIGSGQRERSSAWDEGRDAAERWPSSDGRCRLVQRARRELIEHFPRACAPNTAHRACTHWASPREQVCATPKAIIGVDRVGIADATYRPNARPGASTAPSSLLVPGINTQATRRHPRPAV